MSLGLFLFSDQSKDEHDQAEAAHCSRDLPDRSHQRNRIIRPRPGGLHANEKCRRRENQDETDNDDPPIFAAHDLVPVRDLRRALLSLTSEWS